MSLVNRETLKFNYIHPFNFLLQKFTHEDDRIEYVVLRNGLMRASGGDLVKVQAQYDQELLLRKLATG